MVLQESDTRSKSETDRCSILVSLNTDEWVILNQVLIGRGMWKIDTNPTLDFYSTEDIVSHDHKIGTIKCDETTVLRLVVCDGAFWHLKLAGSWEEKTPISVKEDIIWKTINANSLSKV